MSISVTEAAAAQVKRALSKRGTGVGIRLGVTKSGCSGLAYKIEYADSLSADDQVFHAADDVKVVVDQHSLIYLDGVELDFVKEGLNEGFQVVNPKEKDRCGCGKSFRV